MKVCPLTRRSSPTSEICPNILLIWDVFYAGRVFLYCHGPMQHTVFLAGSILQVFQGFMISLECESLAARYRLKRLISHTTARHSFCMIGQNHLSS